jgi:formylglycine-generating enzyme required for sulfatase activity
MSALARGIRRGLRIAALASIPAVFASCQEAPPPLPSALLIVDTDVDAPRTVSRLRIDVFGEDGTWLHSRDVPRIRASDWPASFGVLSPDETRTTTVLVRLRAYAEGAVRDYRGTRYEPRPTYEPPHVSETLEEICASVEELPPSTERTYRRGRISLTSDSCKGPAISPLPFGAGHVAARVVVPAKGRYRFEVVRSNPSRALVEPDTTLFLRRDCLDPSSEIACHDDISSDNWLSRLVVDLDPGPYVLMTGGDDGQPADLTLRWALESEWGPERVSPPPPESFVSSAAPPRPRLRVDGEDVTPLVEPTPPATIDRVVRIDPSKVRTCIDDPAVFDAPQAEAPAPTESVDAAASARGTMIDEPCSAEDSDDQIVCVPGGTFLLGGNELDGFGEVGFPSSLPVRIAAIHRFWLDRREVTVGRYRDAVASGFEDTTGNPPIVNDGPISMDDVRSKSTYTSRKGDRERYPLNSVSWPHALAFCKFYGGSLPTEAQWEYAASSAGRSHKATFPWGEDAAACDRLVVNRVRILGNQCPGESGPLPVDHPVALRDENPLGILGLAGSMSEFTLDANAPYDSPCWNAIGPIDPRCVDDTGPLRTAKGTSWAKIAAIARNVSRASVRMATRFADVGFRCAYVEPPSRRWRGP